MLSEMDLTDSWIDFFEIFLDPEISPKKNTAFGFLCQNRKSAENPSKTQFSIGQIKKSRQGRSVNWLSRTA